ncbi:uncharacterized protein BDR25DRAFT_347035 [Lindgomyces ingoldianus]|uniref:Uncharacterized protein n=1 Tax=Lindgomyces ingoldianus TaxID=673940 RepID=A0ACB6QC18_9PLEO|nr:uncharacterized protein BDR25DRAFT_347035 [Lindgomyces ingoldianus]KAF2463685.1 hypothetical protein BDR25DRAFT_347035 [Lindgomyces ingoldianus]
MFLGLIVIVGAALWKIDGAYANSCSNCQIINGATLNYDHIKNYNGHLLSDLAGPPTIPTTNSPIQMPSDISWALSYGNTSCYSSNTATCPANSAPSGATCSSSPTITGGGTPLKCWAFRWPVSVPVWETFGSLRVEAPGKGWEFLIYDNVDCSGGVMATIGPESVGACKAFTKQGIAFTARPLWNADP